MLSAYRHRYFCFLVLTLMVLLPTFTHAHDIDSVSYARIEIERNEARFVNLSLLNLQTHLYYATIPETREDIIEYISVSNNGQECALQDFITIDQTRIKESSAPYFFVAKCAEPITLLELRDEFPLEEVITKLYVFELFDSKREYDAISLSSSTNFRAKLQISDTGIVVLEGAPIDEAKANAIENAEISKKILTREKQRWKLFATYFVLGLEHILSGIDHIFFILGFILLAQSFAGLLKGVTGFTISHSITLALASQEILRLSPKIVEPFIALSIAIVGALALFNIAKKWLVRFGIIFLFGLFHGLGFAGAISEVGFPQEGYVSALLGFNVGIEVGQLLVVFAVFPILQMISQHSPRTHKIVVQSSSAIIAISGLLWFVQRLLV